MNTAPVWEHEVDFNELVDKATKRPTKSTLAELSTLACNDEPKVSESVRVCVLRNCQPCMCNRYHMHVPHIHIQCYKGVCAALEKQLRKAHNAKTKLNILYIISTIVRESFARNSFKSKFGMLKHIRHGGF